MLSRTKGGFVSCIENSGVSYSPQSFKSNVDWHGILNRVKSNEHGAGDELYALISKGILFFLRRRMPLELAQDRMHDTFLIVLKAVQEGRIEDPNAFPGYVMTITKRQYFDVIRDSGKTVSCDNEFLINNLPFDSKYAPDSILEALRRSELAATVLTSMTVPQREILRRFYMLEQSPQQICVEMGLTDTQFRLLKSRAKAKFGELGRERLMRKSPAKSRTASLIQVGLKMAAS